MTITLKIDTVDYSLNVQTNLKNMILHLPSRIDSCYVVLVYITVGLIYLQQCKKDHLCRNIIFPQGLIKCF